VVTALTFVALHAHFHEFVARTHGDRESVPAGSPFAKSPVAWAASALEHAG
jgi:hypothetical protein